jgi:hypothetical protein
MLQLRIKRSKPALREPQSVKTEILLPVVCQVPAVKHTQVCGKTLHGAHPIMKIAAQMTGQNSAPAVKIMPVVNLPTNA